MLLVKDRQWVWEEPQKLAFHKIKDALSISPVLALFGPNCITILSADASSHGLGAVLLQQQPSNAFHPVAYVPQSMTNTEMRYTQIEKEALAFI